MKKDTKTLILLGLIAYLILRQQKQTSQPVQPTYYPPAPPPRTPEWQKWVRAILASAQNVAALWAPGGPFYNQNPQDIQQVLNQGGTIPIGNPWSDPTGWT